MGDTCERIYCCDNGNNNAALAAAILAGGSHRDNNDALYALLANRRGDDDNNWMNNPFAYLMFAAMFGNGGFGFGGNRAVGEAGVQGVETQAQLNAIRSQLQDNQNTQLTIDAVKGNSFALSQLAQNLNVDFNTLQKCCCEVQAAIQTVAGQVGFSTERVINAAQLGDCNIIAALKDCCCATQRQIADFRGDIALQMCQQTNTLQRGQDFINRSIERGFSAVAFQQSQDKCDIIRAGQDNTQRIIDTLNNHWSQEQQFQIQDLKNQLSQRDQTDAIFRRLNGCGCNSGCNTGCGCGL